MAIFCQSHITTNCNQVFLLFLKPNHWWVGKEKPFCQFSQNCRYENMPTKGPKNSLAFHPQITLSVELSHYAQHTCLVGVTVEGKTCTGWACWRNRPKMMIVKRWPPKFSITAYCKSQETLFLLGHSVRLRVSCFSSNNSRYAPSPKVLFTSRVEKSSSLYHRC